MEEDLNAKLLAVVGGGNKEDKSSSKSSKKKSTKRRKKKKDSSDEEGEISEESEEEFFDEEPVQKPIKKRKMEEESDEEKFNDGYDSDLMGDDKDREYLSKLSEIEREEILAERYSKRQELLERFKLKQRLKREKDKREGRSSSSRNTPTRTKVQKESKVSALQDIKKRRAKASQATAGSSGDEEEIKDEGEYEEGEEEEVDSEDDFVIKVDKERSRKEVHEDLQVEESKEEEKKKEEPIRPLDYTELVSVCLKRDFFEKQVYEPYFDKLVENCFVRMGIGTNNEKPVYRVAQIVEVKEGSKKYKLGTKKTNKQFLLRHGSSTKNFTFECISNHRPLESEYHKWHSEMERAKLHVMTNKEVKEKLQEIKESRNFQYTEEATVERINRKKENLGKPINIAAERVKLLVQRDACRDVGDEEGFNRFVEQIAQLDQLTKEGKTTIDKAFFINNRNQSMNQARTDVSEIRGAHFSAHPELDPFSRRKTKPSSVISWLLKEKGEEGQQNDEKKEGDSTKQNDDSNGHNKKKEEDIDPETLLKQAHDFDITLDAPPPMPQQENQLVETTKKKEEDLDNNNYHKTTEETKPKQKKPTLSLTDYKRRMGLF